MAPLPDNATHPLTLAQWRRWLRAHHTRAEGVWLVSFKKATGQPRVAYDDAVEEAICFGWIDGKINRLDEERAMVWFAPRKPRTGWSRPNKERVERLIAAGRMQPAGMAKVEQARADGSWSLLDGVEQLEVPADLAVALDAYPHARLNFEAFPRSAKRAVLEWILTAKMPATRANRIAQTARLANENIRANQWKPKDAR